MYKLIIKPSAENDLSYAANWYNQKRVGLGYEFLQAIESRLDFIKRNPNHYQIIHKSIRRGLTHRFPYAIFYTIEHRTIYILAVLHTSKNHKSWPE